VKRDAAQFALKDDDAGIGGHLLFCLYTTREQVTTDRAMTPMPFL
jgi:hypothetical protein